MSRVNTSLEGRGAPAEASSCTACTASTVRIELLNGVKNVSKRIQQVVVLFDDKVVYLDIRKLPFVQIHHLFLQISIIFVIRVVLPSRQKVLLMRNKNNGPYKTELLST